MLLGVFQSPTVFFDTNSTGKISTRFSGDMGSLDKFIVAAFLEVLEGFTLFWIFLIALWAFDPWILLPAGILAILYTLIFFWCKAALDQTVALEARTKGPLFTYFLTTIGALITIRSRNQTCNMMQTFFNKSNEYLKASTSYFVSIRLLTFWYDYVSELAIIVTFCFFIHAKGTEITSGLFVNLLMFLPSTLQFLLRIFVGFRLLMTNTARVVNYCENFKRAPFDRVDDHKYRAAGWPQKGEIEYKNVYFKYSDKMDYTLQDLSAHIKPGEKIAVLGRARGGLSTFVHLLLRTFPIEEVEGRESYVKIDGVNTKDVGLHLLRESITVMPQTAYLFSTTIRENLDPFGRYEDEKLWSVLEDVGLKGLVEGLKKKMDTRLSRGRAIFSTGQKHLLAIARGFLKDKNKIILEDEATARVDISTHFVVQNKIHEKFPKATVITKTTRLWTIADYDKVILMKNGVQLEFDEPYRLLVKNIGDLEITNLDSYFASQVLGMGCQIAKQFLLLAMEAYYKRRNLPLPISRIQRSLSRKQEDRSLEDVEAVDTHHTVEFIDKESDLDKTYDEMDEEIESILVDYGNPVAIKSQGKVNPTIDPVPIQNLMLKELGPCLLPKLVSEDFKQAYIENKKRRVRKAKWLRRQKKHKDNQQD